MCTMRRGVSCRDIEGWNLCEITKRGIFLSTIYTEIRVHKMRCRHMASVVAGAPSDNPKMPKELFWGACIFCIVPFLLQLLGVDFSTQ